MIKSFDFYFDFISPYSYLAHKQIREIEKQNKITINYKPMLLSGLHNLAGITAPAFVPEKMKYMIRDCKMVAEKFNIKFKFNSNFPINSLAMMRGLIFAKQKGESNTYIDIFYDAYWKDGLDLADEKIFISILKKINIDFFEFKRAISEQKIKDRLKFNTDEAYKKGIFGAPSFIVNNKLFWGQDRLEYALKEFEN